MKRKKDERIKKEIDKEGKKKLNIVRKGEKMKKKSKENVKS